MGKGGGKETVTTRLDPQTERYVNFYLRNAAREGASAVREAGPLFAGPTMEQRRALGQLLGVQPGEGFEQFMGTSANLAGGLGAFDPSSIQSFMDPFRQDVIEGTQGLFNYQRELAQRSADQAATAGGAFGSARHGLTSGVALADIDRQESQVIPQLLSGGYGQALNAAMGAWGQQQQTGMGALQNLLAGTQFGTGLEMQQGQARFNAAELFRQLRERQMQEPVFRHQNILGMLQGGIGPYGQTQTAQAGGGNPLAGAFGGALTGFGVGGPIGGLVGGGLGLLGGLF